MLLSRHEQARASWAQARTEYDRVFAEVKRFNRKNRITMSVFRTSQLREAKSLRSELEGRESTLKQRERELSKSLHPVRELQTGDYSR